MASRLRLAPCAAASSAALFGARARSNRDAARRRLADVDDSTTACCQLAFLQLLGPTRPSNRRRFFKREINYLAREQHTSVFEPEINRARRAPETCRRGAQTSGVDGRKPIDACWPQDDCKRHGPLSTSFTQARRRRIRNSRQVRVGLRGGVGPGVRAERRRRAVVLEPLHDRRVQARRDRVLARDEVEDVDRLAI